MSKYCSITTIALGLIAAFSVWALGSIDASAQCAHAGHNHGNHAGGQHGAHAGDQHGTHAGHETGSHAGHDHGSGPGGGGSPMAQQCPHGGQMTMAGPHCFEVVYRPKETRIYLHGADHRPMSMRGVHGYMLMQVRGNDKVFRHPLTHVTPQAGSRGQDYLAATVDTSRIRDGDMTATFDLTGLPNAQQPQANFTQKFAISKPPLRISVVALSEADRAGIARQQVCPVLGTKLGEHGMPVKVLVGNHSLYLCCEGCVAKVRKNPEAYLPKVTPAQAVWTCPMHPQIKIAKRGKCPICFMDLIALSSGDSGRNANAAGSRETKPSPVKKITITTATAADQAAIARQRVCPVLQERLGVMGTSIKITADGQTLFVCCKGCVGKVVENPERYLARAAEPRGGR